MKNEQILIIDDEVDICFLVSGMLRKKNFHVAYAHSLEEGFIKLKNLKPSILFLDINLPDGSGLEAIKSIKQITPDVRILMISAYDGSYERMKAKVEGADYFISKPLSQDVIYNALDNVLERKRV